MKTINVLVRDKIASAVGDIVYICGNSDYVVSFDFDAEWDAYSVKTARFVHNGTYTDVVFTGNQCDMPVIHKAYGIYVGVYAGDLRTTTPAHIPSASSILSAEGTPAAPPDDVYAQITALCNAAVAEAKSVRDDADAGKFNGAPGKTPVPGVDYFTEADKQAIAAEAAKEVGFPKPTSADNGKFLGCENGAAAWLPVDASGGGHGDRWELLNTIEINEAVNTVKISADKDGNPLSLKKAVIVFEINVDTADPFVYISMRANGLSVSNNQQLTGAPKKCYLCYIFNLIPGFGIVVDVCLFNFNYNWIFNKQKMGYKHTGDFKAESMNYFNVDAYSSNYSVKNVCASGKIDVFGVRA